MCYRDEWAARPPAPGHAPTTIAVFDPPPGLPDRLRRAGSRVIIVRSAAGFRRHAEDSYELDPADRQQLASLLAGLPPGTAFVHAVPESRPDSADLAAGQALLALASELVAARPVQPVTLLQLVRGNGDPATAALAALAATISAEAPVLRCRVAESGEACTPAAILAELADNGPEPFVRYSGGQRGVRRWRPVEIRAASPAPAGATPAFRRGGRYLITGGAGGIATVLTDHLVRRYAASIALAGRHPADEPLRHRIDAWHQAGGGVHYVTADVADPASAQHACVQARRLLGGLDGVLHCAGVTRDGLFFTAAPESLAEVAAAKIAGTLNLDAAVGDADLDCFVLFSSLAGVTPNPGQSGYGYANAFQYAFAARRAARADRRGRSLAIAWPLWADGGMQVPAEALARSAERDGMTPLPAGTAIELMERALADSHPAIAVLYGDPARTAALLPRNRAGTSGGGARQRRPGQARADRGHRPGRPLPAGPGPGRVLAQPGRGQGLHHRGAVRALGPGCHLRRGQVRARPYLQPLGRLPGRRGPVRRLVLRHLPARGTADGSAGAAVPHRELAGPGGRRVPAAGVVRGDRRRLRGRDVEPLPAAHR